MTDLTRFRRTTYPAISPSNPANSQMGRTVLVVGASEGIGFGIAQAFAQAHASKVILTSRSQTKLDEAAAKILSSQQQDADEKNGKSEILTRVLDASSDKPQLEAFWAALQSEGLAVDVLVLNAAEMGVADGIEEVVRSFEVNVIARLRMLDLFQRHVGEPPHGAQQNGKVLIDISSAALHCYPYPMAAYSASKAGFSNYLGHIADAAVPEATMRLVSLHPGAVYTSAAQNAGARADWVIWDHPSLGPHMAVWLASPAAAFLHGRLVWANWDVEDLVGMREKILGDAGFLKVGVHGLDNVGIDRLVEKCTEVPTPKDTLI